MCVCVCVCVCVCALVIVSVLVYYWLIHDHVSSTENKIMQKGEILSILLRVYRPNKLRYLYCGIIIKYQRNRYYLIDITILLYITSDFLVCLF